MRGDVQCYRGRSGSLAACVLSTPTQSPLICPISKDHLKPNDVRIRFLRTSGGAVAVNGQAFLNYCLTAGWPVPYEIWEAKEFDLESWLMVRAEEAKSLPAEQMKNKWQQIALLIQAIRLPVKFQDGR